MLDIFRDVIALFEQKKGLEIGGPSGIYFRDGMFPVYATAARLDNCNFSEDTAWAHICAGENVYRVDETCAAGTQFIAEATDLGFIPDQAYDFVLASHVLEHIANPLRALYEWKRVLSNYGGLSLVVPHKEGTFDHRRPVTSLEHMIEDYAQKTKENDLSHLDEILRLHDLALDPQAGGLVAFRHRSEKNFENRCLHHHVFDMRLAVRLIDYVGLQIQSVDAALPYHISVLAQKLPDGQPPENERFLEPNAECVLASPFQLDRAR